MFRLSSSFLLFDYFRVPFEREDRAAAGAIDRARTACAYVRPAADDSKALFWVPASVAAEGRVSGPYTLGSIPIFGGVLPDEQAKPWLEELGGTWQRSSSISDSDGTWVSSIWSSAEGSVFLPFDPNEVILNYWSEGYCSFLGSALTRSVRSGVRRGYYRVRPFIPRLGQIVARRWFSRIQAKTPFPRWPVETALHDLYAFLFGIVGELVDEPVPMISLWPRSYKWALVLTHDVETAAGYADIDLLRDIEMRADYRSSWNFVPRNHHVPHDNVIADLRDKGFEVGVHGLYHDGRDIASLETRLPAILDYAKRWDAAGFRSPATLRDWKTMPLLEFDYDSTYSDTAPYEPQPGGCCSWLPYMIEHLVELPITLPQDHTLFEILGGLDEGLWLDKARFLRSKGGMALVLTHPDYARNQRLVRAYTSLLSEFAGDPSVWKALPREVADWWRRRAASELRRENGGWQVVGPAAELGAVAYAETAS